MGKHNRHSDDDDDMFECAYCGKTHSDDSVAENAVATLNEEQEEKECTMDDATSADGKDVRCMFQCRNGWTVAYGTKVVAVTNAVRSDIPWGEDVVVLDKNTGSYKIDPHDENRFMTLVVTKTVLYGQHTVPVARSTWVGYSKRFRSYKTLGPETVAPSMKSVEAIGAALHIIGTVMQSCDGEMQRSMKMAREQLRLSLAHATYVENVAHI